MILILIHFRVFDILCDLFAERMPQDKNYKYKPDTVNIYFENRINASIHQVDARKTIKEITADKKYELAFYLKHFIHSILMIRCVVFSYFVVF